MNKAGTLKIGENWTYTLRDLNGNLISVQKVTNTITNTWKTVIRDWMYGGTGSHPVALAIGTGTNTPSATDTTLQIEYSRQSATASKPSSYVVKYSKDFTFGSGTSEDITEAGLFDSVTASGSTMIARNTCSAISVTSSTTLTVEAEITIAEA